MFHGVVTVMSQVIVRWKLRNAVSGRIAVDPRMSGGLLYLDQMLGVVVALFPASCELVLTCHNYDCTG